MRRLAALLLVLLAALARSAPAAAQAPDSAFLRPGDVIHLVVWRQPEFTGDFPVGPEGTIQHPLLSTVSVVGVPRSVIRDRLRESLSKYERDPNFVFDFLYRIAVEGEVRLPNLYNLPPETTVGQALAAAGGVTEFGRLDRVQLVRGGQETIIDLRRPSSAVAEMRIRSGDQIRVSRHANILRDYVGPFAAVISALAAAVTLARVR